MSKSCSIEDLPYIPPMADIDNEFIEEYSVHIASEADSNTNDTDLDVDIAPSTPNSISHTNPPAVLFEIKGYELNQDGQILMDNQDERSVGEVLNSNEDNKQSIKPKRLIEDAEPDPINYDNAHWKRYNKIKQNKDLFTPVSSAIGCKLRTFQCFSFLGCLFAIVAVLTDSLTVVTGQHAFVDGYSDSIICGWSSMYVIQYDDAIGVSETTMRYDANECENAAGAHVCDELFAHGIIWILCAMLSIVGIFTSLVLFCCVLPMKPQRFKDCKSFSSLVLVLTIVFEVIGVISWVSDDYCSDKEFINSFYDKQIEAIHTGSSIDVMVGSMLCSLVCVSLNLCVYIPKL
eukprot:127704_1